MALDSTMAQDIRRAEEDSRHRTAGIHHRRTTTRSEKEPRRVAQAMLRQVRDELPVVARDSGLAWDSVHSADICGATRGKSETTRT